MRHSIDDVIDSDAIRETRGALGIHGTIGPFPGITHIRVMANRHHQAAFIITDAAPSRYGAVRSVVAASPYVPRTRNLHPIVQVIHNVKYFVVIFQIFDWAIGEDLAHTGHE